MLRSRLFLIIFTLTAQILAFPPPNSNTPVYGYINNQTGPAHLQDIYQSLKQKNGRDPIFLYPNGYSASADGSVEEYRTSQSESLESQGSVSNEVEKLDNISSPSSLNETSGHSTIEPMVSNTTIITNQTSETSSSESSQSNSTEKDVVPVSPLNANQSTHFYSTIYNKTLIWLSDEYTLSILLPVASGFVIAAVVIVLVAMCNLIRRRCCGRRLRRKTLTDAIRGMNAADRAKLLAESSDEEF